MFDKKKFRGVIMKRTLTILGLLFLVLITACTQQPELADQCAFADGNWLPDYEECEYMSEEQCNELGGEYNSCASACRHHPDADVCTMQCVPVCSFN